MPSRADETDAQAAVTDGTRDDRRDAGPEDLGSNRAGGEGRGGSDRSFLAPPPRLRGRTRRIHQITIGVLLALGAAQGVYWTFATMAWSPIDEQQHFAYVESMARGHGVPTIGVDRISDEVLASVKEASSNSYRSSPLKPVNTDIYWSSSAIPYQALQPPPYYIAMVPFYWLGQPLGVEGSLYAVRLGTALLALAVIPLTWLLARRLFPSQPIIWLLGAGLIAAVNGISPGTVTNDTFSMVIGTLAIVVFLRTLHRSDRWYDVVVAGAVFGLCLLAKMTSLVLVPFLAVAFIAWLIVTRPRAREAASWIGRFVIGAGILLAPWLLWNLATYRSFSGSHALEETLGQTLLGSAELTRATIEAHLTIVRAGVWHGPVLFSPPYRMLWERAALAALVFGMLAGALRRRWRDVAVLAWCGTALPLGFVVLEAIFLGPFNGNGSPVGRHLLVIVPLTVIMIGAGATLVVGARWAPVAIAWLVTASLWIQVGIADEFVTGTYLTTSLGDGLGPVVYQDRADELTVDPPVVLVDAGCAVGAIGVGFATEPPPSIEVSSPTGQATATGGTPIVWIATYRLDEPMEGPLTITIPPQTLLRSTASYPDDQVGLATGTSEPVVTAFCVSDDPDSLSFDRLYRSGHPDVITLGSLRAGPRILLGAVGLAAVALTAAAISATVRRRSGDDAAGATPSGSRPD